MQLKLKNVRLSFPELQEATQFNGKGPFKYRAAFIVDPKSPEHKMVNDAITAVIKEKWPTKAAVLGPDIRADKKRCGYQNGDKKDYDGYAGNWIIGSSRDAKRDGRPKVLDANKAHVFKDDGTYHPGMEGKLYSGCYVNAILDVYAYDNEEKGVAFGLAGVQFYRDGDAFSGGKRVSDDDFDDVSDTGEDSIA